MKAFIGAVVFCFIVGTAVGQNDGPQAEGLQTLSDNRNRNLVGPCNVTGNNILTCPVLGQSLVIDDQIYLKQVELRLRFCASSLWPIFDYSNETRVTDAADNLQSNTTVTLGQLALIFEVLVCLDEDSTTVIRTSIRVGESTMFSRTDIPLTAQIPENCPDGITRPTSTTSCPPLPTTPPTTPPTMTTNAGARGASINHISLIAVFAAVVCLLLTFSQ